MSNLSVMSHLFYTLLSVETIIFRYLGYLYCSENKIQKHKRLCRLSVQELIIDIKYEIDLSCLQCMFYISTKYNSVYTQ